MSESNPQQHHQQQQQRPPPTRPFITIPQRSGPDIFTSAFQATSPSPMTMVSNFFADNFPDTSTTADFRGSFSQLLAGAMSSPSTLTPTTGFLGLGEGTTTMTMFGHLSSISSNSSSPDENGNDSGNGNESSGSGSGSGSVPAFKQNRPAGLMVPVVATTASTSALFPVSPGFSPSSFFNSPVGPGLFPPALNSPFGISHQQALAHVQAAAAAFSQSTNYPSSTTIPPSTDNQHQHQHNYNQQHQPQPFNFTASTSQPPTSVLQSIQINPTQTTHHHDHHQQPQQPQPQEDSHRSSYATTLPAPVDKPADDGYNWRKYGQKPIKGSEYPRSYYKCTIPNCPVKKKVERSRDGRITEIIYRGQHNHVKPQPGKRNNRGGSGVGSVSTDHSNSNNNNNTAETVSQWSNVGGDEEYSGQDATSLQLHGPSDSEESGEANNNNQIGENEVDEYDEDERNAKRRNTGNGGVNVMQDTTTILSHKTVTEPKIIVQTRSQVDLLDDGYRWRKYGQKVVKGNPNPRSYYKCTTTGCGVRKHIERSSTDAGAVITTYEGKHNHDIPIGRNGGGRSGGNNNNQHQQQQQLVQSNTVAATSGPQQVDFTNQEQRPIAFLRLKEEQQQFNQ